MSLMEMSFSGAVLILVILAVRAAFKGRLPKRTFVALWLVALLRLLVPFSVPSAWSVYSASANAFAGLQNAVSGNMFFGGQNAVFEQGLQEKSVLGAEKKAEETRKLSAFSADISEELLLAAGMPAGHSIWKVIWAAGVLICLAFFSWIYCRCCREFRMSLPVEKGFLENWRETHPLRRKLSIRQSDQIVSPISYGVWHPVILLSKSVKCGSWCRLRYVLEHEYVHIQYFDAAVKLLMVMALCVHWFNPFVYLMYIFLNRDLELACDETVVHRFGEEQRAAYAMALIEMEEEKSGLLPLGNSFSKNAIEERIGAIMKIKKMSPFDQGLSVVLVCSIALLFATSCGTCDGAEKMQASAYETTLEYGEKEIQGQVVELEQLIQEKEAVEETVARVEKVIAEVTTEKSKMEVEKSIAEAVEQDVAKNLEQLAVQAAQTEAAKRARQEAEKAQAYTDSMAYVISKSDMFSTYKKFGLSYDKKTDYLMYENKNIGYFKDEESPGVYTRFVEKSGELGVIVQRSSSGKMVGLRVFPFDEKSISEFDTVGEEYGISAEASSAEASSGSVKPEAWESKLQKEYTELGMTLSDGKTNQWMYHGKGVAVIYDKGHWIYTNEAVPAGNAVCLEVKRDKKDRITELKEVSKKEIQRLLEKE